MTLNDSKPAFTDVDELAQFVASKPTLRIVGIDGWTGVGKSTLAKALASKTGGTVYDLDSALNRDRKAYVPELRLDEIAKALSGSGFPLFVSGICLREVFDRVGVQADAHIYVREMAAWGWVDEDELDGALATVGGSTGGDATRREMREYHAKWRPHVNADVEFHRFE